MDRSTTKTTENNSLISTIFKGTFVFLCISLSLFHVFFNSRPKELSKNNLEYKSLIENRDSKQHEYLEQLKLGTITSIEYYQLANTLISDSNKQKKIINNAKRKITKDFSFRGRSSFHFWLFVFGLITALFYFACKSLFDEITRGSTFKHQLVSIAGIIVSCFWFVHLLFFTQNDFNKNTYFFTILGLAGLFTFFTYYLVKYYTYKDFIIKDLVALIVRIKSKHYPKALAKVLHAEKYDTDLPSTETAKSLASDFDTDIKNTFNAIES